MSSSKEPISATMLFPFETSMPTAFIVIPPIQNCATGTLLFRIAGSIYRALIENIKNDEVFQKSEIKMWECRYCGHIHIGKTAPKTCPMCGAAQAPFEINKINY
jgi:hypothetical protein